MNSPSPSRLGAYRAALEFVFWACRETLKLALLTAVTAYCIASLLHGELPWLGGLATVTSRVIGR